MKKKFIAPAVKLSNLESESKILAGSDFTPDPTKKTEEQLAKQTTITFDI